ncbi:MAG: thioredoxin family protein [Usitatibacter sp.]
MRFLQGLAAALLSTSALAAGPYPAATSASMDVDAAIKEAAASHKRVLIDFGGNWCTDCKVLDLYLHRPENEALLARFVIVRVNVGDKGIDTNFDVARRYGVPLEKGVPAMSVLDSDGRLLYAQKAGEFESMRSMEPKSVHDFLARWSGK